jgi:hypothetical protein
MKILALLLLGLVLIFPQSCDKENYPPTTTIEDTIPSDDRPQTNQYEESGILLTITTDKTSYLPGETVHVTASVENLTPDYVKYTLSSLGYDIPLVSLWSDRNDIRFDLEEEEHSGVRTVLPIVSVEELAPYEKRTRDVVWDQQYWEVQAPQGIYQISCYLEVGDYYQDEESLKTISAVLDININSDIEWITAEQAKSIALALPEIQDWLESHSGKNLVKKEDDDYYILMVGEWIKVSPNYEIKGLTLEEFVDWVPEVRVYFRGENWVVNIGDEKYGNPPYVVIINVDVEDGTVNDILYDRQAPHESN